MGKNKSREPNKSSGRRKDKKRRIGDVKISKGNFRGEQRCMRRFRGSRGGSQYCKNYRGNSDGYNHHQVGWNNGEDGYYQEHGYQQNVNTYEDGEQRRGFQKFRDPNERNVFMQRHINFGPMDSRTWYNDGQGDLSLGYEPPNQMRIETPDISENKTPPSELVAKVLAEPSPTNLKEPIESKEPKLLHKIKAEKVESDTAKPNQRKTFETSSSGSDSNSDEEKPPPSVQNKSNENAKTSKTVKIKKEPDTSHLEKKKVSKDAPPVVAPPSPSTESSSSESSSSDSTDEEETVPTMPKPLKLIESVKPKTEETHEDDVVCLGKQSNIENLIDDESNQSNPCMVCKKQGHSPDECQTKCKKCSQSVYEMQTVCKNCGETYTQRLESTPKPPNPFAMFMQFMQFCMRQYSDTSSDIKYPFPQFENPSAPVLGPPPVAEVTRKDIANSKRDRKRAKSGSKHSRKKARTIINSDKDSDSDSSSKATTSTKKRKRLSKSSGRDVESAQTLPQPQPQNQLPQFGGHLPFSGGAFGAPGYNPMLAFCQMMGFNPSATNFTR